MKSIKPKTFYGSVSGNYNIRGKIKSSVTPPYNIFIYIQTPHIRGSFITQLFPDENGWYIIKGLDVSNFTYEVHLTDPTGNRRGDIIDNINIKNVNVKGMISR